MLSFQDDESKGSEKIWQENGFFDNQRAKLTIAKAKFPENMLCYINQDTVSLVKGSEKTRYLDFVVLGQIIPVANVNPKINLDDYDFKENDVLIYCQVYNKSIGLYGGLTKKLGRITLREDAKEHFFFFLMVSIRKKVLYFIVP